MIARLAKKLGMKKRKNLPTKFREDGLDCILLQALYTNTIFLPAVASSFS